LRKLKLALALPIIQFIGATLVLRWDGPSALGPPTLLLICRGLNAPALLLRVQAMWGPFSKWVPGSLAGVDTSDLLFLVGVLFTWYFVGRALDRRRAPNPPGSQKPTVSIAVASLLLATGGILLFAALAEFRNPNFADLGPPFFDFHRRPEEALLTLIWSVSLIFLSLRGLTALVHRSRP
jgi:hypothetical protein